MVVLEWDKCKVKAVNRRKNKNGLQTFGKDPVLQTAKKQPGYIFEIALPHTPSSPGKGPRLALGGRSCATVV